VPVDVATRDGQSVLIHLTNPTKAPVTVTLSFMGEDKDITVDPKDVRTEFIPRPTSFPSGLPTETARLKSKDPYVASVTMTGSCSSYLAIPTIGLGMSYQIITWDPSSSLMGNAWFTVSTVKPALITITLPEGKCTAKSSYISLECGDTFSISLPEYAAITFNSVSDLSGTTVDSTQPVLVIAGNDEISIGSASVTDDSVSEFFPVKAWGTTFVVPAVPNNDGVGYSIKMSSKSASVKIQSSTGSTSHTLTAGKAVVVDFAANPVLYITSDNPIQVVQFVRGGETSSATGCPSSLNVLPTSLYLSTYYVSSWQSKSPFTNFVTIIIEASALASGGLMLNDEEAIQDIGWVDVPGSNMKTRDLVITGQFGKFSHSSANFVVYRYSNLPATDIDKPCALFYAAGADYSYAESSQESTLSMSSTTMLPVSTTKGSGTTMAPQSPEQLITDCSCLNITSTLQPSFSGQYVKEGEMFSNKPVYKRQDCDLYLFDYDEPTVGFWLIGPTLGSRRGSIVNSHIYQLPNETNSTSWYVYDPDSKEFKQDPGFKIVCSCTVEKGCDSGEFMSNGTSLFDGVFSTSGEFYNGRPVYWHESHSLVLYYKKGSSCQYWVVSDKIGSTSGVIYSFDTADNPGDVTTWQQTGSSDSPETTFSCYSGSNTDS